MTFDERKIMMKAALYPNFQKQNALSCALAACDILTECGIQVSVSGEFAQEFSCKPQVIFKDIDEAAAESDFIIAIGGDGTMLRCAKHLIGYDTKMLGINTGRLGFMACLEDNQLEKLALLKSGDYKVSERMLLNCSLINEDGSHSDYIALNDICVSERYAKICDFSVYSQQALIGKYRADGVLFSTPTGSTAYALSAGGPIIEPELECIEMTLICPHSLFSRPMLFSSERILEVENNCTPDRVNHTYLSIDGEAPIEFGCNRQLLISKSSHKIKFIDPVGNSFHETLGKKLMRSIK
jgi:NAD+ kinase